ncbi:protein phosphatase 1 regulatory subunit 3C-B-like [Penaeus monodon]|uniref:protein phosphatase 1 regulatory subunit 3C-B-like n=1 Tax=Penaeus monodon TaxID=6687 RepID=UPI0018A7AAE1|nr:protein phosphatase 1 regulatory subunit 3C-B-like [Penaeus monodon]XP_037778791.1 protein phosphatase 1 regulatory subunit 3C-B-like [Penaeus monodon]
MTTLMMPSDYGVEMYLGSSPVLTSGYLAQPFIHDYSRLPLQAASPPCQASPLQASPLHTFWGHSANTTNNNSSCNFNSLNHNNNTISGSSSSSSSLSSSSSNNNNNYNHSSHFPSSFRSALDGGPLSASCSSEYSQGLFSRNTFRRASSRRSPPKKVVETPTLTLQPIKSCLVARQEDEYEEGAISPTRLKKRVVFADDQGHPLTQVRLLTERSDCPPRWTADFLEQVTGGAQAEALADQWELAFRQPASDYLGMKARLEANNVSLENVLVKESEARVTGTVKVRNLSYHKQVKVRYTTSNWAAHDDVYADYVPSAATATGASYDLYDTFTFALPLPSSSQADKLEFCVCYSCHDADYWDNNNNQNYVLVSFRPKGAKQQDAKPLDAYHVSLDAWSEFASWNHLSVDDSPYW